MAEAEQRGVAAGTGRGARADIFREIGITKLINAEDYRLEAATNPERFHQARKAAIERLKDEIQAYYTKREREYERLGYTNSESKRSATLDADEFFKAQMRSLMNDIQPSLWPLHLALYRRRILKMRGVSIVLTRLLNRLIGVEEVTNLRNVQLLRNAHRVRSVQLLRSNALENICIY